MKKTWKLKKNPGKKYPNTCCVKHTEVARVSNEDMVDVSIFDKKDGKFVHLYDVTFNGAEFHSRIRKLSRYSILNL